MTLPEILCAVRLMPTACTSRLRIGDWCQKAPGIPQSKIS